MALVGDFNFNVMGSGKPAMFTLSNILRNTIFNLNTLLAVAGYDTCGAKLPTLFIIQLAIGLLLVQV